MRRCVVSFVRVNGLRWRMPRPMLVFAAALRSLRDRCPLSEAATMHANTRRSLLLLLGVLAANGAHAAAGRTPGKFVVGADGSANYSVPLWTPSGVNGLKAQLALDYHSNRGNGLLGVGWAVRGLSAITRCRRTVAQDNTAGPIELSMNDRFCLDGQRLRLATGSAYGDPGTTYRTEIETFARITAIGSQGNGPASFQVETKDGLIYKYGETENSRIEAGGGAVQTVAVWALNEIGDRSGNAVRFVYTEDTANGSYRIARIDYPYNTVYGGPYYQVVFGYETRADVLTGYSAGYRWQEANRLGSIKVQTYGGGTELHRYDISWESGATTTRSRIASIRECVGDDCLPPTTIDYQEGAAGWNPEQDAGQTVGLMADAHLMDFNGDGSDDLVYPVSGGTFYVLPGSSSGFGAAIDTGVSATNYASALPLDFNSDGKMDLLIPNGSNWRALISNGTTFAADEDVGVGTTALPATGAGGNAWIADYDGDGRPDLLYAINPGSHLSAIKGRRMTNTGFSSTEESLYTSNATPAEGFRLDATAFGSPQTRYKTDLRFGDFNGDGRIDVLAKTNYKWICSDGGCPGGSVSYWTVWLSKGTTLEWSSDPNLPGNARPYVVDVNGDGLADILYAESGTWTIRFGAGDAHLERLPTSLPVGVLDKARFADFDGDGRTDILTSDGSNYYYARSTGNGFADPVSLNIPDDSATQNLKIGDVNGDGLSDWVYANAGNGVRLRRHVGDKADLATAFTDGFGITAQPAYTSIAQGSYTKGTGASYPYMDYQGPLHVVDQITASTGTGGNYTQSFTYEGAILDLQGRGLQGFKKRTQQDSRDGLYRRLTLRTDFPFSGMVAQSELLQANGTTMIESRVNTLQKLDFSSGSNAASFPYVGTAVSQLSEPSGAGTVMMKRTVTTVISSANYGTPSSVTVETEDRDPGLWLGQKFTTTVTNANFMNSTGEWCVGRPRTVTTVNTLPDTTSETRTANATIDDAHCRVTSRRTEPNSALQVATGYEYDDDYGAGCGNVMNEYVTGTEPDGTTLMSTRATSRDFGTRCQLPETVTNALGQATDIVNNYDLGVPAVITDPNGLSVQQTYDLFGRPDELTRPDGTRTDINIVACDSGNTYCGTGVSDVRWQQQTQHKDVTGEVIRTDLIAYDGFDRPRYLATQLFGGVYATVVRTYDALGRLERDYVPSTTGSNDYRQYSYDTLGRVVADALYKSGELYRATTYGYAGRTVTVTNPPAHTAESSPDNQVVNRYYDVRGQLRRVVEPSPGATTDYRYDPFGNLVSVKDAGNVETTWDYNVNGHLIGMAHPDRGNWTYVPNSLGELVSQTDAMSQTMSLTYDTLGRPLTRTETEGQTTWIWGTSAAAHEIGQLNRLSGPGYAEEYAYDPKGRLAQTRITAEATDYYINREYSASTGLLEYLTYPESYPAQYRFRLKYEYDHGVLKEVADDHNPSNIFWQLHATDARGNALDESLAIGTSTPVISVISGYDPLTGLMDYRTAGKGSPYTNHQNLAFEWDLNGNLKKRTDNNEGGLYEEFFYDALNRLDQSGRGVTPAPAVQNLDMSYAADGRIASRAEGGVEYGYLYDPIKKHAVRQVQYSCSCGACLNDYYGYDANGNMTSRPAGGTVSWYSYNLPNTITQGSFSSQFAYTPNRARWKQVANYDGTTETTLYIGGMLEKVTRGGVTEYKHLIPAGSSALALHIRRTNATNATYYVTRDQLGSATAVMAAAGNRVANWSFSAFGSRRRSTWQDTLLPEEYAPITATTRRGFTGHEHLDNLSLVHMNGRVYDPKLGRFISADPVYIGNLATPQSLNPYSYVMNNPLTFTDPSGFAVDGITVITRRDPEPPGCDVACMDSLLDDIQRWQEGQWERWLQQVRGAGATGGTPSEDAAGNDLTADESSADDEGQGKQRETQSCANTALRIAQVLLGGTQALAGAVQTVEGAGQVAAGIVMTPGTFGGSVFVVAGGVANSVYGSSAVLDGGLLFMAGVNGAGDASTSFGLIGEQYGGATGGRIGEVASLAGFAALAGREVGTSANRATLGLALAEQVIPMVAEYVCGQ